MISNIPIVLGSTSERRLSILQDVLKYKDIKVVKPDFEENLPKTMKPTEYVKQTSYHKLLSIIDSYQQEGAYILICCDTVIDCGDKILEKPQTKAKQAEMFRMYQEVGEIKVISALQIAYINDEKRIVSEEVSTTLKFDRNISQDILNEYIESEEGLQVAGGFKYQELGNVLFLSISGDYFNVVGLPAKRCYEIIHQLITE